MPNQIDLDHLMTWIMDINEFNKFVIFVYYFYDNIRYLQNQASTLKKMFI
jgi:hypothetical protein